MVEFTAYSTLLGLFHFAACGTAPRRPHSSELDTAEQIIDLGGTYSIDDSGERHIVGVWVSGTKISDEVIVEILKLPHLKHLSVNGGILSDGSLQEIFSHTGIVELDVRDTQLNRELLVRLSSMRRMFLVEDNGGLEKLGSKRTALLDNLAH